MNQKKESKKALYIVDELQRKRVQKYIIRWGLLGFFIGAIVSLFSIPINDYALFNLLGKITPGIDIWTNGTIYQHTAKAMWIFVTYSVPFVIYKMIVTVKKAIILMPIYCLLIIPSFAFVFSSVFLTGCNFGFLACIDIPSEGSSIYISFYSKTIIGAVLIPLALGASCIIFDTALLIYIIEQLKLRRFWEKNNG